MTGMMQENSNEEQILQVRMFGTFSMNYNGKPLVGRVIEFNREEIRMGQNHIK